MKNYNMKLMQTTRLAMPLLLLLVTSTPAWAGYKLSQAPMGNVDGCQGGRLAVHIWGWTCDPYYETEDLSLEEDCSAEEWSKVSGRHNWYLQEPNRAEIHLLKDGEEVKVATVNPNIVRNDVVDYYNFYTSRRDYVIKEKIKSDADVVNYILGLYLWFSGTDPLQTLDEYPKHFDKEMGFDTWIDVDEPGTYHVIVYGTNVHGNEENTLLGERDVIVANGYAITLDANTTDAVGGLPMTQYKSQVKTITIPEDTWRVERTGYTFLGWNTEPGGDGKFYRPGTDSISTNADFTLYAQWVRNSFFSYNKWVTGIGRCLTNCPTTISSVDDWNDLATLVNNGYLHGKDITLVNDIGDENNPITRCIGTQTYPFDNNFNGDGHTIYVDINDTRHEGTAPFRCVGLCPLWRDDGVWPSGKGRKWVGDGWAWQISKLKVKGTVRGGKYCSGLVGISSGVDLFLCAVQTDVITNSTHCAGVIGYVDGTRQNDKTNTTCTVFSGSISGATQSTGIFIGARKSGRESTCNYCLSTGTVSGANIDLAPPSEVTYSFKTTDYGKQGTYIPYDPAAIIRKMVGLSIANDRVYRWCVDDDGSILPFHQVFIDTATDWDKIATRIANGASFKNRELILNSNITVSTMLGTAEHPFDGTFDGQNKTLTFNLETNQSGCAPFRYIKDAEIKNLNIGGTLAHSVGAKTRLAGVAAYTSGNNALTNLTVNSTIRSQASSFHHAGLVAQINDGRVRFQNCAFKGELLCDANSSGCGGLVAVNMGESTSFVNCLFAPTACTVGADNSCTISRDIKQPSVITGTCYTQELGEPQGTRAYTVATAPDNVFCYLWTGPDNVNYYQTVPTYIGGLQHTYNYNEGNPIDIDYTFYCYQNLLDASKYTATFRKATDDPEASMAPVASVTEIGQYTLAITANDGSDYHGTVERPFYVTASSLPMNDKGHFLINSANDWNKLCELSSDAHQEEYQYFEGRVVELTNDITITQQLPTFSGTLAGNGHTLTFNYGTTQSSITSDGAAPIDNLRGNAVVENLHVVGTIVTSTGRFTSGLVGSVGSEGSAQHNVRINNCRSSIRIKTTYNGECHNGGFVGFARSGKLTLNNCLFDGCFTSLDAEHVNATHWAGFVGYKGDAEVSFNSCLYFSNIHEREVPSDHNATFYLPADASSVSLQNCCHTEQNLVNSQGTYVAITDIFEAGNRILPALGYEGWQIVFDYPQWQASYPEAQTRSLVLPRYEYHTAVAGYIDGLQGNGTAGDPYLIGSTQDWNVFATSINNNVGTDAFYQLTEDITIDQSQTVGTTVPYVTVNVQYDDHRTFRGTFDGNGHTLTLSMATNGACAPFIYAQDCTIKDLTVDGIINTSNQNAAGLIVNASGTVNITGCRGSLTINSSYSGASRHGGFVAKSSGTTNFEGCLFDGSIIGATTYSCGGFVGSRPSGTVHISNSFFTPDTITLDTENASDNSATFCAGDATITNSFYTQPIHAGQGTALYSVTAAEGINMSIGGDGVLQEYSSGIAMKGDGFLLNNVFYALENAQVRIERLQLITGYSPQDATIVPNAGTYANGTLTMPAQNVVFTTSTPIALSTYAIRFDANGGTGDAMANMNFTYGDDPKALTENTYTRTANSFAGWNTAADGSGTAYTDGQMVENLTTESGTTIILYAQWEPWIAEGFGTTDSYTPDGTAEHPYIISTAEEWNLLCDYISSGKGDLASCHYRLGNNITVSRMLGTEANPFRGTFEGQQCTLTLDLTGIDPVEVESIAPDDSENIEDPEGMEYPEGQQSSQSIEFPDNPNNQTEAPEDNGLQALAPFAYVRDATIKNLRTTGTIYGESHFFVGGIVGFASGTTTLQSCHSSVAITSTATIAEGDEESPMLGGIVGQCFNSLHFTDCLFDGTINAENTSYCGGFLGLLRAGEVTFTNCLMDGELNCATDSCGTFYQPNEDSGAYVVYTVNNSYYHTAYGAGQGTQTDDTGEDLKARLGNSWAVTAEEAVVPFVNKHDLCYAKLTLEQPAYPYTGSSITVGCIVKNLINDELAEGTDYTVTFKNAEGTELNEVTELGEYILTINGTGNYVGSKSIYFYVYESDGTPFPLQTDDDFQSYEDGYFYVRMPREEGYWPDGENPYVDWHEEEDNPRIVNIPPGFTRSFKVYDDGGKNAEYNDYDYLGNTLTLNCPEGYTFYVQGTMDIDGGDNGNGYLTIYDGEDNQSPILLDAANGRRNVGPLFSSDNSITFYLYFDENHFGNDGFDLTVQTIEAVPPTDLANDDSQLDWSEKNPSVIAANDGEQISVTLDGRTLYRDGTWHTLCLPFDIPNIAYTPLRGATIKTLSSTSYSDGTLTLDFSHNLTRLEAGKPYIVKWYPGAYYSFIDPDVVTALNFISEVPEVDDGQDNNWLDSENYDKLVDGNTYTKYFIEEYPPYVEFHYTSAITPKGYALWTANDKEGARNPSSWTIKAKNEGDGDWTTLVTVDNSDGTKLPMANKTCTIFPLDNSTTYQYFRFEVFQATGGQFQLAELQFCTVQPDASMLNIVNPTFRGVTIKDELHPVEYGGVTFGGNYSKLTSTNGLLLDTHNAGGNAFHAALSLPDVTLYADAEHTTPVGGDLQSPTIPFAADGTVKFYYTQSDLALTLHDDDSQAAANEKNADLIAAKDGEFSVVTLDGRTLYRDSTWNTISLPFDIDDINHSPLRGATVKAFALERTENNDGALTLNFSEDDLTSIEAGKPYIVKWEYLNFPAKAPSKNTLNMLGFVDEIPILDSDETNDGPDLVDGDTDSQFETKYDSYFEFHYEKPITPTGYALWTANEGNGEYNPESWAIYAWNVGDEEWTELVTVNNEDGDQLPPTNSTCTLFKFKRDNSTAYQYFVFTVNRANDKIKLSELQFFTARPNTNIVNPVFEGVTIKSQTDASDNIFFEGSYSTLASTEGQMLDAHNDGGKAFHAALSLSPLNAGSYDFNCYTDADHTTPVTSTIPFNASDGSVTLYPTWALTLNNDDSQAAENKKNAAIISEAVDNPAVCNVTLAGRMLYKDGDWNTLCLPFNLGNLEAGEGHYFDGTLLEGATVKMLESTEFKDGTLTMNFRNVPMVIAGFPFIVKWEGDGSNNLVDPVFTGVTIANDANHVPTDYVDFVGTYSTTVIYESGDKHNLYLGSGNNIYYPSRAGYAVKACRAYFRLKNGLTAGDPSNQGAEVRAYVLKFDDEDEATGIISIDDGQWTTDNEADAWYDLDGRRLSGKPATRGVYINNGHKIVIK